MIKVDATSDVPDFGGTTTESVGWMLIALTFVGPLAAAICNELGYQCRSHNPAFISFDQWNKPVLSLGEGQQEGGGSKRRRGSTLGRFLMAAAGMDGAGSPWGQAVTGVSETFRAQDFPLKIGQSL